MKSVLAVLLTSMALVAPCRGDSFDYAPTDGLTIGILGAARGIGTAGWEAGWGMVSFSEPINTPWFSNCVLQRFYLKMADPGGRAMYQTLMLAKVTGKKVTRVLGYTADPNASNICEIWWLQIEP
jgi:hypothetical protein